MRLIDADALIEKLEAWKKEAERRDANINYAFASAIIAQVNAEPTIEERKTGKWIRKISVVDCATFVGDECSQCGYFKSMGQANFCPNCGADMRGGEPHETP